MVRHVKSNAIVLVKNEMLVGVGAGQMNRVGSARIAIEQAGDKSFRSVLASDAYFPMPDIDPMILSLRSIKRFISMSAFHIRESHVCA